MQRLAQNGASHTVAEPVPRAYNAGQNHLRLAREVLRLIVRLTVPAVAAGFFMRLTEIVEQISAQAVLRFAVACHGLQPRQILRLHCLTRFFGQFLVLCG